MTYKILKLKIAFDSINCIGKYNLNSNLGNKLYSEIEIQEGLPNNITKFNGKESPLKLTFIDNIRSNTLGIIKFKLDADLQCQIIPNYHIVFSSNIYLSYKIK